MERICSVDHKFIYKLYCQRFPPICLHAEQRNNEDSEDSQTLISRQLPDLPNVDGPIEDDSSDDELNLSKIRKKHRSYRPLTMRRRPRPNHITSRVEDSKTLLSDASASCSSLNSSSYSIDKSGKYNTDDQLSQYVCYHC